MNKVVLSDMDLMILNKYRENCLYDPKGEIIHKGVNDFTFIGLKNYNFITIYNAKKINMPKLEEVYSLDANNTKYINLPSLIKAHDITLKSAIQFNIPVLKDIRDMNISIYEGNLEFPELEKCGTVNFNSTKIVNLPKLKEFEAIYCRDASIINIPKVEYSSFWEKVYADNAKKIIVPKGFLRSCLKNVKRDCEIIYVDEEETTNESFKSFFNR